MEKKKKKKKKKFFFGKTFILFKTSNTILYYTVVFTLTATAQKELKISLLQIYYVTFKVYRFR